MAQQTYGEWMRSNPKAPTHNYKTKSTKPVTNNHTLTAVEWLAEQLPIRIVNSFQEEIAKAKQMEKEQLNFARLDGINLANKGYGK